VLKTLVMELWASRESSEPAFDLVSSGSTVPLAPHRHSLHPVINYNKTFLFIFATSSIDSDCDIWTERTKGVLFNRDLDEDNEPL